MTDRPTERDQQDAGIPDISDVAGVDTAPLDLPSIDPAGFDASTVDATVEAPLPGPISGPPPTPPSAPPSPPSATPAAPPSPPERPHAPQDALSGTPGPGIDLDATHAIPRAELPDAAPPPPAIDPNATQLITPVTANPPPAEETVTLTEGPDPTGPAASLVEPAPPSTAVAAALAATGDLAGTPPTGPPDAPAGGPPTTKRSRRIGPGPLTAIVVLAGLAVFIGAWGIDQGRTQNQVVRRTTLGDTPVGGMDVNELDAVITELDAELADVPLTATVDQVAIETNPAALGAHLDRAAVAQAALDARRGGNPILRPFRWLASFVTTERIEPIYTVESADAQIGADDVVAPALDQPVDPELMVEQANLVVSEGKAGLTVDPEEIAAKLPAALEGKGPYEVSLNAVEAEPKFTNEQVEAVASEANEATAAAVEITVLDQKAEVGPELLRNWVTLDSSGDEPTWAVDSHQALTDLKPLFPSLGSADQRARFNVVDGKPIIIPASQTIICCDEESIDGIRAGLLAPAPPADDTSDDASDDPPLRQIELKPETVGSDEGVTELESLGIVEEVSTFTTMHPCCQNRVTNIHQFADIVQGAIIRPGEDFSLNGYVGERTLAKGFVADHAIANGVLKDQVGGGVSQFATTFFNASFFAGLDFNEYQSHSLYISRYPKGREATISWRKPDLSVKNTTPYGILVWPTYTGTSLTVTFYSTKYVDVTAEPIQSSPQGKCTRYTTPRTRVYLDGREERDSVFATYRPGEGLDCNGNSTEPPSGPTIAPGDSIPGLPAEPVADPAPAEPVSAEPVPAD